jgi:Peptidase MA superfamily
MERRCGKDSREKPGGRKSFCVCLVCLILGMAMGAQGRNLPVLQSRDVTVYYDPSLDSAAKEIIEIYPKIRGDLENVFQWKIAVRPSIVLIKKRESFLRAAESPLSVAFAVPRKNLIVIDYSRMLVHPFRLEVTLKHELSHILLHQHISDRLLPRWLDEGLCQWVSDGIDEIMMDQQGAVLNRAALTREFLSLNDLRYRFPRDEGGLILAYQESKGFVTYLFKQFGEGRVLELLSLLANGTEMDEGVQRVFSSSVGELEEGWHRSIRPAMAWLVQISTHLYEILFVLASFISLCAFIRLWIRKRRERYREDAGDST